MTARPITFSAVVAGVRGSAELANEWQMGGADVTAETSGQVPPFSTSDDGDSWMDVWCRTCVRDGDLDAGNGCPLILQALLGETPREWVPSTDYRYVCASWSQDPAHAPGRPGTDPAQLTVVDPEPVTPDTVPRIVQAIAVCGTSRRRPIRTVELPDD